MAGSNIANKGQFRKISKEFGEGSHANCQNTNFLEHKSVKTIKSTVKTMNEQINM